MKILIFSDTHKNISKAIDVINRHENIDEIIHLGDNTTDAEDLQSIFQSIKVTYVKGNCDFYETSAKNEQMLIRKNLKILITHGHRHQVKYGYENIYQYAKDLKADILLFGHTHIPFIEKNGNLSVMNPGSGSGIRAPKYPTFGILQLENDGEFYMSIGEVK